MLCEGNHPREPPAWAYFTTASPPRGLICVAIDVAPTGAAPERRQTSRCVDRVGHPSWPLSKPVLTWSVTG